MVNMLQDETTVPSPEHEPAAPLHLPVLDVDGIVAAMDAATARWHAVPVEDVAGRPLALHLANFELWHLEDAARSPFATSDAIADTKRAIDRVNQRRNDAAEAIDADLLQQLAPFGLPHAEAPLHSETPGQMLDRLSILALKRYHTAEEERRADASPAHRERNRQRLAILAEQSSDLARCLQQLWVALCGGERRFKRYRQLKMYNDPDLNPVLYQRGPVR